MTLYKSLMSALPRSGNIQADLLDQQREAQEVETGTCECCHKEKDVCDLAGGICTVCIIHGELQ